MKLPHFKNLHRHKKQGTVIELAALVAWIDSQDSLSLEWVCPVGSHWAATCLHTLTQSRLIRVCEPDMTGRSISLQSSCFSAALHDGFCTLLPLKQKQAQLGSLRGRCHWCFLLWRQQLISPSVFPSSDVMTWHLLPFLYTWWWRNC